MPGYSRRGCFVYYEIYIDQFFLEHLVTDGMLLALTAAVCRRKIGWLRLIAGGIAGAAGMTLLLCTGHPELYWLCMAGAGTTAFWAGNVQVLFAHLVALALVTCCFGGVLEAALQLFGLKVLTGSTICAAVLFYAFSRICREARSAAVRVKMTLFWEGRSVCAQGFVDTGNQLREPLTGRPVSILSKELAEELLGENWELRTGFFVIPYHSIGREAGWLRAVAVDRMLVEQEGAVIELRKPVLAICEDRLSMQERNQVILHPEHAQFPLKKKRIYKHRQRNVVQEAGKPAEQPEMVQEAEKPAEQPEKIQEAADKAEIQKCAGRSADQSGTQMEQKVADREKWGT